MDLARAIEITEEGNHEVLGQINAAFMACVRASVENANGACESEIEKSFLVAYLSYTFPYEYLAFNKGKSRTRMLLFPPNMAIQIDTFDENKFGAIMKEGSRVDLVFPQTYSGRFRCDFIIFRADRLSDGRISHAGAIIECDGHDFHEKTKDQAQRDKSRDRELQLSGVPVLRFTGSELFRDAYSCAKQVAVHLEQQIKRLAPAPAVEAEKEMTATA